jgi:hypothetical protein
MDALSIDIFKPEIWSARLQRHLDRVLTYGQPQVCNRDWEGDIAEAGDTVHINKLGDPTIKNYVVNTDMDAPERPDGTTKALIVDQTKYFNVAIDDVDDAQTRPKLLDGFSTRAGVKMAQTIDAFLGATMATAATTNQIGTDGSPVVIKADGTGDFTPYQFAVEMRRLLASRDAPLDSLWLAISTDLEAEFLQDAKFTEGGGGIGDATVVRNGTIGRVAGFDILRTTGTPSSPGSGGSPVANHKMIGGAGNYATTFANQLAKIEAYRIQNQFGDGIKGLEVYGAKVLEPETLVQGHVAG